ncbi:MAG TPA: 3'-5' exonuclease [Candidatus Tumulicola sp.]|nr:3'-5' exonuclease [Candidatus Tumulicola sp.]
MRTLERADSGRLKPSASLRAEVFALSDAQARVVEAPGEGITLVTGPAGSGKTSALAARAARFGKTGAVVIVCSHESGVRAMRRALDLAGAPERVVAGIAPEHLAHWMRSNYALANVSPKLRPGGDAAARSIVRIAGRGLLDLSWPMLRAGTVDLDLPFLSRPDAFLDEAAQLFRQLRRSRIGPAAFEEGCRNGLDVFYGSGVERALVLIREPGLGARASRRGREAMGAREATLLAQRRAEHDLGILLSKLYTEYIAAAQTSPVQSDEDIVDACLTWLERDARAARALAGGLSALFIDDAEDAEPAVAQLLELLLREGLPGATLAGCEDSGIDGLTGRRSVLDATPAREWIALPLVPSPHFAAQRFKHQKAESDAIAEAMLDLLRGDTRPADIALLTRSHDAAAVYAEALAKRGVPIAPPRDRPAAAKELADWLALAVAVHEPLDHEHLLRVLSSPLVGLSDASLFALCDDPTSVTQLALDVGAEEQHRRADESRQRTALARNVMDGSADQRLPEAVRATVRAFRENLARWRDETQGLGPSAVLAHVAVAAGFHRRWISGEAHLRSRLLDDEKRVIEAVVEETRRSEDALPALVRRLQDGELPMRPALRSEELVACEAIVDAKGERWPHVFVAGLAYERFPRVYVARAMAFTKNYGLIVRENVAAGASQTAKFGWYYAKFDAKARYLKEERRALRYALSRGTLSATASGFGTPPRWAADHDLLADLENSV